MARGRGRGWARAACAAGAALSVGVSGEPISVTDSAGRGSARRLATCETLTVTGGYRYTPGTYAEEGSRNGESLYVSEDRTSELFFTKHDDGRRRARRERRGLLLQPLPRGVTADPDHPDADADADADAAAEGEKELVQRGLGACNQGYWSLAPAGSGYPRLVVGDCAGHPADIKVTVWSEVTCADCAEQTYNGAAPGVACAGDDAGSGTTPSPSSAAGVGVGVGDDDGDTDAGGGGGDGDGDGGVAAATAPPTAGAPAPVDDSCKVLEVGGRYPGLYTVAGTYNGKGDYYSEDRLYNIFFESTVPSSAAATQDDDDDDDDDSDDDSSGDSDDSSDDDNRRRRMLTGMFRERPGERSGDRSEEPGNRRGLAACTEGYWVVTPTGGGYPFFAVAECAVYPENVPSSSTWQAVTCDGCAPIEASSAQTIECATGPDAIVATPSPVQPVQMSAPVETLPGAGPSTCEKVTVTGARAGAYTVGGSVNDAADVYSDDGKWRMFFAGPAPALSTRRARNLAAEEEEEEGGDAGFFSAEVARQFVDERPPGRRGLQACDGYWYITPVDARYPAHAVFDCAEHPSDIFSTDWVFLQCEDCEVITANPKPAASCTGAPVNAKRGGSLTTPSPAAAGSATLAPAVASVSSTCTDLYLTGDFPGNYTATGTYRGKPDFFNQDGTVNLYFELATTARRRSLSSRATSGGGGGGGGGGGADQNRPLPGDAMAAALEEAYGSPSSRRLAACSSGYWILSPVGGDGYPVLGVPDCSEHPADIRANQWLVTTCATCGVQDAPSFVAPTVTCADQAGAGASDTPSPGFPASCTTVYVTGPAAGVYLQSGDYGSRGDFFSGNSAWNMYWTFYAGKPVNRNRFRRGLSVPDRGGAAVGWSEEYELALEALAADLRRDAPRRLDGEGRRLEVCDDGFWLITPRGGGFPFYGTLNCAEHPAEIGNLAAWSVVECDGCGSTPVVGTIGVTCDGVGFTPPPSTAGGGVEGPVVGGTPSPAAPDGVVETSSACWTVCGVGAWRWGTATVTVAVLSAVAAAVGAGFTF